MFVQTNNLSKLKGYILSKLGIECNNIEMDEYQLLIAIEEAFQKFTLFHFDGATEDIIRVDTTTSTNEYSLPPDVISVLYVINDKFSGVRVDDEAWVLNWHSMNNGIMSGSTTDYTVAQQYLALARSVFSITPTFAFNNTNHKIKFFETPDSSPYYLYVYRLNCAYDITEVDGEVSEINFDLFNNDWLRRYATELARLQWGMNLSKFTGAPLPGGATINSDFIVSEAKERIEKLDEELRTTYELPPQFFFG